MAAQQDTPKSVEQCPTVPHAETRSSAPRQDADQVAELLKDAEVYPSGHKSLNAGDRAPACVYGDDPPIIAPSRQSVRRGRGDSGGREARAPRSFPGRSASFAPR